MSWLLVVLVGAPDPIEVYRRLTVVGSSCAVDRDSTDITVCGRRNADRFRVPFKTTDAADRANETVPAERTRLQARTSPIDEMSPFLVGGGMAGVSVKMGAGGVRAETLREPAP